MLSDPFGDELRALLAASRADEAFKRDVLAYVEGRPAPAVLLVRPAPRLKVLRLLAHLMHAEPALCATRVRIEGYSGCADFRGSIVVECADGRHEWRFRWDCRWRASQEGYVDDWGVPDQVRAAREFGWRCFSEWAAADVLPGEEDAPARGSSLEHRP